ncbi:hypothetical protein [Saccharopolyspora phatthalungensis]|uniref:Uncharacterized protein n=1 Tax=Saccharopolyspora phatthalungensis TaxID=664693 RepID=A0A840PS41_9PSEU|nr:hypothetical protein [Saccharopolyspora phatthalungensis]MBB5153112.1 hypothetical protein [Saccharopolyspora phatthalungensis]
MPDNPELEDESTTEQNDSGEGTPYYDSWGVAHWPGVGPQL